MNIELPVSIDELTKYSLMSSGVIALQQVVNKTLPEKNQGFKYWLKMSGATVLGVVGGSILAGAALNYQKPVVVSRSSASKSTKSKESDVSQM